MPKSRGRKRKPRGPRHGVPPSSREPEFERRERILTSTFVHARALLSTDPGLGLQLGGTLPSLQFQRVVPTGPVPVILLESKGQVLLEADDGRLLDRQIEGYIAGGWHRCQPGSLTIDPVDGWNLRQTSRGVALYAGGAAVWAEATVRLPPEWVAAAAMYQRVVVLFGFRLGVAVPSDLGPARYGDEERRAELEKSRAAGHVACGTVRWYSSGEAYPGYELLDLRDLGIPMPVFAFPYDELTLHGGPEVFGFEHFGKRDANIPLPYSDVLGVDLHQGPHDLDVLDLRTWTASNGREPPLMVGLKSPQPRPQWWDAAAVDQNTVLLLASVLNARSRPIADVAVTSWVCLAHLFLRAYPEGVGTQPPPAGGSKR